MNKLLMLATVEHECRMDSLIHPAYKVWIHGLSASEGVTQHDLATKAPGHVLSLSTQPKYFADFSLFPLKLKAYGELAFNWHAFDWKGLLSYLGWQSARGPNIASHIK